MNWWLHDRGPGLPESELSKVMAPFYRVEGSRNRQHGGVGLGLSIAHDIARHHQGQLSLRNGEAGGLVGWWPAWCCRADFRR